MLNLNYVKLRGKSNNARVQKYKDVTKIIPSEYSSHVSATCATCRNSFKFYKLICTLELIYVIIKKSRYTYLNRYDKWMQWLGFFHTTILYSRRLFNIFDMQASSLSSNISIPRHRLLSLTPQDHNCFP
jgi:hypothetical protein